VGGLVMLCFSGSRPGFDGMPIYDRAGGLGGRGSGFGGDEGMQGQQGSHSDHSSFLLLAQYYGYSRKHSIILQSEGQNVWSLLCEVIMTSSHVTFAVAPID
jgi:hypothetical protein